MSMFRMLGSALALLAGLAGSAAADEATPARELFGAVKLPAAGAAPEVVGSYAKGCVGGAVALPVDGPSWQVMRLQRNRNWGHPDLVRWLEDFAASARAGGWTGLLVGDMAQPRGGPMRTGHASHQIGLDADIWLSPMPDHVQTAEERETLSATSMLKAGTRQVDEARFGRRHLALLRTAAETAEVERIFVHPGIKRALCDMAGADRAWLAKVRPWWGHDSHFHVRLRCPAGAGACRPQEPVPAGDGCGSELAWWLSDEPWKPSTSPPPKPLTLADLPPACRTILTTP